MQPGVANSLFKFSEECGVSLGRFGHGGDHCFALPGREAAVNSDSSGTIFDAAPLRVAYLPRTNPFGKSEPVYSRRSSSVRDDLVLCFIHPPRIGIANCTLTISCILA